MSVKTILAATVTACVGLGGFAAETPGSADYVQDGLVAHWDGIDNTLSDGVRSHSASATIWHDLTGNGNDVPIPQNTQYVEVEANALLSKPGARSACMVTLSQLKGLDTGPSDAPFTVEIVMQRGGTIADAGNGVLQSVFATPRGVIGFRHMSGVYKADDGFFFEYPQNHSKLVLRWWGNTGLLATDIHTLSAVFGTDSTASVVYQDAGDKVQVPAANTWGDFEDWKSGFEFFRTVGLAIRVYAIRIYNRPLTVYERALNQRLDSIRFLGTPNAKLPEDVVEAEYIESTGTQIIDTGYLPNQKTKMETSIQFVGAYGSADGPYFFGAMEKQSRDAPVYFASNFANEKQLNVWLDQSWAGNNYSDGSGSYAGTFWDVGNFRASRQTFTVTASSGVAKYGTLTVWGTAKSNTHMNSLHTLRLFGAVKTDSTTSPFTCYRLRVYDWMISEDEVPVRDFVPCLRLFDQQAGLFDTVGGKYHANDGTGNFEYQLKTEQLPEGYHTLDYVVSMGEQIIETGVRDADAVMAEFTRMDTGTRHVYTHDFAGGMAYRDGMRTGTVTGDGANVTLLGTGDVVSGAGRLHLVHVLAQGVSRRFVPCYREADGVAGLYELTGGTFHPSVTQQPLLHGTGGEVGTPCLDGSLASTGFTSGFTYNEALTNFSFAAWVRNPDAGDTGWDVYRYGVICAQGALGDGPGFCCFVTRTATATRQISVQLRDDGGATASLTFDATAICSDDKWHHIAFTRDYAGGANLYLDGKVMAMKASAELVAPPTPAKVTCKFSIGTRLGNNGWGTYPYRGQLAQVSLWGRALTAGEIGRLRIRPVTGEEEGLLDAWALESGAASLTAGLGKGKTLSFAPGMQDIGFTPDIVEWFVPGMTIFVR